MSILAPLERGRKMRSSISQRTETKPLGKKAEADQGANRCGRPTQEGRPQTGAATRGRAEGVARPAALPDYLVGRARDAWTFWSHELELMDLDRRPDGPMLEGVCIAYDAAISCYETIKTQGRFIAKRF